MIQFSLNHFPQTPALKDACGLPWGCTIKPFASTIKLSKSQEDNPEDENTKCQQSEEPSKLIPLDDIARCKNCFGYINPFVNFQNRVWKCSICKSKNEISPNSRYSNVNRSSLPELRSQLIDYGSSNNGSDENPLFVAIVDLNASQTSLDNIKKGLLAVIEALPKSYYFMLVTFSDTIGLYDLSCSTPHTLHVQISTDSDILTLHDLACNMQPFVQIGYHQSNVTIAIESLVSNNIVRENAKTRAFGPCIEAVIEYLTTIQRKMVRIVSFLCGPPNIGEGSSSTQKAQSFYKTLAHRAFESSICIELYCILPNPAVRTEVVGLASIKYLAIQTGGNIHLYYEEEHHGKQTAGNVANLPQEIYRRMSGNMSFDGMLRIRTSGNFRATHTYGYVQLDSNYDNLYHTCSIDEHKSITFDFEFTDSNGFARLGNPPIIQIAFAFSTFDTETEKMVRRLRVCTVQIPLASNPAEVYSTADSSCILSLLCNKIIKSCLDEGVEEAKMLIQDWMAVLLANYNNYISSHLKNSKKTDVDETEASAFAIDIAKGVRALDVAFSRFANLKHLPRFAFGLLKNPLLSNQDADYWCYLQSLYSGLSPHHLTRIIYPCLYSFGSLNTLASKNLYLSQSSVVTCGCRLFLLDAFQLIIIFYADTSQSIAFPPPKDSLIRRMATSLKNEAPCVPELIMVQATAPPSKIETTNWNPNELLFYNMLLEDSTQYGEYNFSQFLETVQLEASKLLGGRKGNVV